MESGFEGFGVRRIVAVDEGCLSVNYAFRHSKLSRGARCLRRPLRAVARVISAGPDRRPPCWVGTGARGRAPSAAPSSRLERDLRAISCPRSAVLPYT